MADSGSRARAAGKFTAHDLSYLYSGRGFLRMQKGELDLALADLNEAARIDSSNLYAFWSGAPSMLPKANST